MTTCDVQAIRSAQASVVTQTLALTMAVLAMFVCTKSWWDQLRRRMARCTVFVIGG